MKQHCRAFCWLIHKNDLCASVILSPNTFNLFPINLEAAAALTHTSAEVPACADCPVGGVGGEVPPCPGSSVGGQSGSCLPGGCSAGSCPEVPSRWQQPCAHTAMFRSRDSLSLAALVRKHLLCSLLVLCALWMLRAPLGLVCDPCCTA